MERSDMRQSGPPSKKPEGLPSALERLEGIRRRAEGKRLALFLDYDGTLTPIVDEPEDARLSGEARKVLSDLAAHFPVALISGRDRTDLRQRVAVDKIVYAGSHGFEIIFLDGGVWEHSLALDYLSVLEQAQNQLGGRLKGIEGARVERKKFSLSVHFRQATPDRVPDIEKVVHEVVDNFPELRQSPGKKIRELQPRIDWNKGKALLLLLEVLGLGQQDVLPLYIGDDETDEDAFRVLQDRGVSIRVGEDSWPTAAHYSLKDPGEVQTFLQRILSMGSGGGRR
jgi:trehalose 6-phosphate phosphatase